MAEVYFANETDSKKLGAGLVEKVDEYYRFLVSSQIWDRVFRSRNVYWGLSATNNGSASHKLTTSGSSGELSRMRVNHYRNIAQHMLMLTVSQRPAPQPIATNTDAKTHEQVTLAHGLIEYYSRQKRVERNLKTAVEHAIVFGEGYVHEEWDPNAGRAIGAANGESFHEGDIVMSNPTIIDVIKDPYRESNDEHDWYIVRKFASRYEYAARYPEMADKLMAMSDKTKETTRLTFIQDNSSGETDDIAIYRFYHRKTKAVPFGKYVEFADADCIFLNTDLQYREIPVRRIIPSDFIGSSHGYTPMFDLIGIQDALDALYSVVVTNQRSFGVQNVLVPEGHNISVESLAGGLNLITYDSKLGKPESLNLTDTPQEVFAFISQLESVMETLSGINSTVRGNPEASLKSGTALALVQAQAIQFSSGLQASYAQLVEDVYTDILNILKDYAKTKRVALIVGKYNRPLLRSFTGDNLEGIDRVVVDSGNPLSKTASGRIQMAQDLLQGGFVKSPEEYISVVVTGKIDSMTEGLNAENMLIKSENELLSDGQPTPVTAIDAHRLHIQEHKTVLSSPEARSNPAVVNATLDHISQHIEALKTTDPNLLALLGEQSLMLPPPTPEEEAGGTPPAPPDIGGQPPPPQEGGMPSLPINPATGNQWDPETGGGVTE